MDIQQFLTTDFLFNPVPSPTSDFYLPLLIFFNFLIVAAVAILIFAKGDYRKFLKGYISPFLTAGFLGDLHLFARYEALPWLSARIVLILLITMLLSWLLVIAIRLTSFIPEYREKKTTDERYSKYLPKPKRKKGNN